MAGLARIFIALTVCPVMGAFVGRLLGSGAAVAAKAEAGVVARWEMNGLLGGVGLGLVYAGLLIYCAVGCQGRLRRRIADPVILALGFIGVTDLLMSAKPLPTDLVHIETGLTVLVWLLGLLFVGLAVKYRPSPGGRTREGGRQYG